MFVVGCEGVGCSVVVVNLGVVLVCLGKEVLIIDEYVLCDDVVLFFGLVVCYDLFNVV